jgi:hypothetical protein
VQGFEVQVLTGMGRVLDRVLALEMELPLRPLYAGQATLMEMAGWMNERGFILRDLESQGPFDGEALEFNTFWSRKSGSAEEKRIIGLWEAANGLPPAADFETVDAVQRKAFYFND